MKSGMISIFILFFAFVSLQAQTVEELISEGDAAYKMFDNQGALKIFEKADSLFPDNWEVKWRLSRTLVDIGEHMPSETSDDEEAQIKVYERALALAEKAVALNDKESVNYLRRAIANGKIALFKGVFSVAGVVNKVKADCEKSIQLNTGGNEVQGTTHYVFARTHSKISEKWAPARSVIGLGWADWEVAIKEFQIALELRPEFMMVYLDYAKALMREDLFKEALNQLEKGLKCPHIDEDDSARVEEIKTLIAEVKEELE